MILFSLSGQNISKCLVYQSIGNSDSTLCSVQRFDEFGKIIQEDFIDYYIDASTIILLKTKEYYYSDGLLQKIKTVYTNSDSLIELFFYKNDTLLSYSEEFVYDEESKEFCKKVENWNETRIDYEYSHDTLVLKTARDIYGKELYSEKYEYYSDGYKILKTDYGYPKSSSYRQVTATYYLDEQCEKILKEIIVNGEGVKILEKDYDYLMSSCLLCTERIWGLNPTEVLVRYYVYY